MKTTPKIIIITAALLAVGAATNIVQHFELPRAKVTVKVVDEHGASLENANVKLVFGNVTVKGATDANGLFAGEGRCGLADMGSTITKDGYYLGAVPLPERDDYTYNEALNRWEPWNATYVAILRPIVKPIALYARIVRTTIPQCDQSCGFDLEMGDWVPPYGKGKAMDFVFLVHQEWRGISDYNVEGNLTFKNSSDGIKQTTIPDIGKNCIYEWARQAPETGYDPKQILRNAWFPESSGKKPIRSFKSQDVWDGYFFRVRTVEQDGRIVSALYGKIRGGIAVYPDNKSGKPRIVFAYYLNPSPNDRNLEWDPKRNLFGGLSDDETLSEP